VQCHASLNATATARADCHSQCAGVTWQHALSACLVAGIVMLVLAVTRISDLFMKVIPLSI